MEGSICHSKRLKTEASQFPYAGNQPQEERGNNPIHLVPAKNEYGKFECWVFVNGMCGGLAPCEPEQRDIKPEQIVAMTNLEKI